LPTGSPTGNVPDPFFELSKLRCLHLMNCPSQQPFLRAGTEGRELPEATGNRSQVQVGQNGASRPVKESPLRSLCWLSSQGSRWAEPVTRSVEIPGQPRKVGWRAHRLCDLVDFAPQRRCEKLGSDSDVRDSGRVKSHEPCASGIRRHRSSASTIRLSGRGCPFSGPFPSIAHNRIGDNEVNRHRGANVEDTFLNSFPMKNVFGQPYFALVKPEHVFI